MIPEVRRISSVTYGDGLFVAVGWPDGEILTSTNAVDWTIQDGGSTSSLSAVTYGNEMLWRPDQRVKY